MKMQTDQLGERLISLRRQAGLSQEELGKKLCVTRQAVSKWEKGAALPGVDNLAELARIFSVSVDDLLLIEKRVSPAGLSAEGVGQLLDQYERQRKARYKRLIWIASPIAVALAAGIIAAFIVSQARVGRLREEMNGRIDALNRSVSALSSDIVSQIDQSVSDALSENTVLTTDGGIGGVSYDDDNSAVVLNIFACPLEMSDGQTARFTARTEAGETTAEGVKTGSGYEAALSAAVPDGENELLASVYLTLIKDGEEKNQLLETRWIYLSELRVQISDFFADWSYSGGTLEINPYVTLTQPGQTRWAKSATITVWSGESRLADYDFSAEPGDESVSELTWKASGTFHGVTLDQIRLTVQVIDNLGHTISAEYAIEG